MQIWRMKLDFERINSSLDVLLNEQFQTEELVAFDIKFIEKPKSGKVKVWKGYNIEFKAVDRAKYDPDNITEIRKYTYKLVDQSTNLVLPEIEL